MIYFVERNVFIVQAICTSAQKYLVAATLLLFALFAGQAMAEKLVTGVSEPVSGQRVALVIGNADYPKLPPLKNPVNDARDMAAKLRKLGFEVIEYHNVTRSAMHRAITGFGKNLHPDSVALFYYAGHGIQARDSNYLIPVDAEINSEKEVPLQGIAIKQIIDVLGEAKTRLNLVFVDASFHSPYVLGNYHLGAINGLPVGTIISYATIPGGMPLEGVGRNGLYTEHLLKQMDDPNQPVMQMLKRVMGGVKTASQGKQMPWMEGSIEGDFCFGTCRRTGAASAQSASIPAVDHLTVELAYWNSIKNATNPAYFDAYLKKYPDGQFAALARIAKNKAESDLKFHQENATAAVAVARAKPITLPANQFDFGNYHALVIGINNYRSVTPLKTAVTDAQAVAEVLQKDYGFKVTLLLDAARNQVLDAFDDLRRTLTEHDNLLIYYAGHGYLDSDSDRGFWLPVDADANHRANWLSNSDLADMVRATRAKHVLVVADSCYAGTLTRNLSVQMTGLDDFSRLAQKRARTALTSGGLEPVEDSGGGQHSVFAKAFLGALQSNSGAVDMSQIFSTMRHEVMLNSQQTPQYGDIRQAGHEGGDFIFVRRKTGN